MILKNSEYGLPVVEQLNKMPARISILGLLIAWEAHRNAFLKILNEPPFPYQDSSHFSRKFFLPSQTSSISLRLET